MKAASCGLLKIAGRIVLQNINSSKEKESGGGGFWKKKKKKKRGTTEQQSKYKTEKLIHISN
jgi:hypothetical protein